MANVRISQERNLQLDFVVQKDSRRATVSDKDISVKITDASPSSKNIKAKDYPNTRINDIKVNTIIKEQLPFRVKFLNKGFSAYSPENPPPIGVAVIGFNNYIL